jgi:hypothetical protein
MDILDNVVGGTQRQGFDNFVQRYDQGAPWVAGIAATAASKAMGRR